jgi:hypothetical protein
MKAESKMKPYFLRLTEADYSKLNQIMLTGKYRSRIDFFQTKIREETV